MNFGKFKAFFVKLFSIISRHLYDLCIQFVRLLYTYITTGVYICCSNLAVSVSLQARKQFKLKENSFTKIFGITKGFPTPTHSQTNII